MTDPARPAAPAHPVPPADSDDDRGCLRVVLALPFAVLTLIAAYFCWMALTIRPAGVWDDDAYRGIVLSCVATIAAAGSAVVLWLLPSVRRVMGWAWVAPALHLGVTAAARWAVGG
ncbi:MULTISPECIES: hypothetical protein [unclassified Streptomyces]|uniref:hypothetical protein n=1 Tax=unclassified Streptomyces TaxID=2593676 RepID=UPI002DD9AA9F|nr:hypothetical protein [Streptomyces sp. NBC_01445]WSE05684.1 hypothetical protein OG574_21335 [Streptomyces sp. NBC_01445]